jgi:hypothetical protein
MLVDVALRERLSVYCLVKKSTQEVAANEAIAWFLEHIEQDPSMKEKIQKATELREQLRNL